MSENTTFGIEIKKYTPQHPEGKLITMKNSYATIRLEPWTTVSVIEEETQFRVSTEIDKGIDNVLFSNMDQQDDKLITQANQTIAVSGNGESYATETAKYNVDFGEMVIIRSIPVTK